MFAVFSERYFNNQRKYNMVLLSMIVITQIIVAVYFEYNKDSMFGDELFSYAFANAYFTNTINNPTNSYTANAFVYFYKWLDSSVWQNMFTVQEGQQFAYDSVIYNQNFDISPPLHTLFLHSICSLFPNVFSKWFGFSINVTFFCLAQFFLYKICEKLFSDNRSGLLACAIYGFSWGGINTVVYLRMYMMMICFALCLMYLSVKYYENTIQKKDSIMTLVMLFINSLCGVLTHLHFLSFAFFVGLFFVLLLWIKRYWVSGLRFGFTLLGSVVTALVIHPRILDVILGKGDTSFFVEIKTESLYSILKWYLGVMNYEIFGGLVNLFFVFFATSVLTRLLLEYYYNKGFRHSISVFENSVKCERIVIYFMLLISASTFFLISYLTVYIANRYVYIFYPFLVVIIIAVIMMLHDKFRIVLYLSILLISYNIMIYNTNNLHAYEIGQGRISKIIAESKANALIVEEAESFWPLIWRGEMLMEAPYSYLTTADNFDDCVEEIRQKDNDKLLVFLAYNLKFEHEDLIKQYSDKLGYVNYEKVCNIAGSTYLLSK